MDAIGGQRGVIGVLITTGVVALPIGLVVADIAGRNWHEMGTDAGKVITVIVIWVLLLLWAVGGGTRNSI